MKKKLQILLMLLSCFLLATSFIGCGNEPDMIIPGDEAHTTIPTEELHYNPSAWPQLDTYLQPPILQVKEDKDVYISLNNQNCDFYPNVVYNGVAFDIITREYYHPNEISVVFPGKTTCEIRITERNKEFQNVALNNETGSYNIDGQQPYHYLCMQRVDLKMLGQQSSDARYAANTYMQLVQNNQADVKDYSDLFETYVEPYNALYQTYMDSYVDQSKHNLTSYNAYTINVIFDQDNYVNETIEYIDISLGNNNYHLEFGEWRIHEEPMGNECSTYKGINLGTVAILGTSGDSPYAGGYVKIDNAICFNTSEDIILTGLRCSDATNAEILGAQVESTVSGNSMNYFWDGVNSAKVAKASNLTVDLYLRGDCFKEYEVGMTTTIFVDYIVVSTGEEFTFMVPCQLMRFNKMWDTYCLAFLGIDVGEYYHYFRDEVMEVCWINEIPESWRKE